MDATGLNLKQLTFGLNEADPECSRDGKWVYYVDRADNMNLKRISVEGGTPETIINIPTGHTHCPRMESKSFETKSGFRSQADAGHLFYRG